MGIVQHLIDIGLTAEGSSVNDSISGTYHPADGVPSDTVFGSDNCGYSDP